MAMTAEIGKALRDERLQRGWSQRELARRAGIHHRTVQYWESKLVLDLRSWGVDAMAKAMGWPTGEFSDAATRARGGVLSDDEELELIERILSQMPRSLAKRISRPRVPCGAKTRKGTECRALSEPNRRRCRFHGGLSTGPKTEAGRARIAEAQRRRWDAFKQSD